MQSLSSFQTISTPMKTKAAAKLCKCGWMFKLGELSSCKHGLAALESQDMSVRKEKNGACACQQLDDAHPFYNLAKQP
jgi:hypothetical protein